MWECNISHLSFARKSWENSFPGELCPVKLAGWVIVSRLFCYFPVLKINFFKMKDWTIIITYCTGFLPFPFGPSVRCVDYIPGVAMINYHREGCSQ